MPADQERWSAVFQRLGYGAAQPLAAGVEGTVFRIGDGLVAKVWRRRTEAEVTRLQAFYDDLAHSGLPFATPRILAIGSAEGSVYSLEPELDGRPLAPDDGASRPLPRAAVEAVLDVLGALAEVAPTPAMHRLPVLDEQLSPWVHDTVTSGHRGEPDQGSFGAALAGLVERRVARAPAPLRAALPDLDTVVSAVIGALGDLDDVPLALVHGDLIPANILVDDQLRPTAVLDFGFLTLVGDPAMDAAITATVYDMYSADAARIRTELDAGVADRFAYPAERIALYRAMYALATATAFDLDGRDGHFRWCVQTLTRPDVRDLIG